jgi:uncharacterized GH25 family protein
MTRPQSGNSHLLGLIAVVLIVLGAAGFVFMSGPTIDPGDQPPVEVTVNEPELEEIPDLDPSEAAVAPTRTTVDSGNAFASTTTMDDFGDLIGAAIHGRIVTSEGQPVDGASVALSQRYSNNTLMRGYKRDDRFEATTGPDGRFRFNQLALGIEMNMWVSHPEYAPAHGPPFASLQGDSQDLGDIILNSGHSIHGTVKDEAGNPIPGLVEIRMQPNDVFRVGTGDQLREEDLNMGKLLYVTADHEGNFEANKLVDNIWNVTASHEGYSNSQKQAIALHGKPRLRQEPIHLVLGEEYFISGIVQDEHRQAIPGAIINVARSQPRPVITADAVCDENGQFRVRGLQAGTYGLSAQAPGYSNGRAGRVDANTSDLIMVLQVKGGVSGRVTSASGQPMRNFTLEVLRTRPAAVMYGITGLVHTIESTDGSYNIGNLDPGSYILLARSKGMAATYSSGFTIQRDMVDGIDIPMQLGGIVSGRVVDAEGNPLAGAEISLHGQEYNPEELTSLFGAALGDPNNVPSRKVRSDRKGEFRLDNAYLGSVQIMVKHQLHLGQLVPTTVIEGSETDLGDIRLFRGSTIFGVATDYDGKVLAGGTINLTRKDGSAFFHRSTTVDARGRYRFDGLDSGSYQLAPFPDSNNNAFMFPPDTDHRSVFLQEGEDAEVDLVSTMMKPTERKPGDRR